MLDLGGNGLIKVCVIIEVAVHAFRSRVIEGMAKGLAVRTEKTLNFVSPDGYTLGSSSF